MFQRCRTINLYYLLTYPIEDSPSWEAHRFSGSQEIPRILWNPISLTFSQHDSFLRWAFVSTLPNPQARGPPLSAVHDTSSVTSDILWYQLIPHRKP